LGHEIKITHQEKTLSQIFNQPHAEA
jgi:hypothetical protein